MACTPTPTTTLYTSIASTSTSSTFTDSVTTIPPVVTTVTTQTCSAPSPDSTDTEGANADDCVTVDVTEESTLNVGTTATFQVPVQVIYQFTQVSPTATLFASCSNTPPSDGNVPLPPSSSSFSSSSLPDATTTATVTSSTPPGSSSPSTSPSNVFTTLITPAPSVIVMSQSSTRSDGSVILVLTTLTSTFPPLSVVLPVSTGSADASAGHHSSSSVVAPVVGGILGGFFGLIGLVVLFWCLWRRRRFYSRPSTPEPPMAYRTDLVRPDGSMERRPYVYGAVGSINSQGSRPGTPRGHDSVSSPATPRSANNRSSTRLSFTHSGAPTPTFFASTAIQPGQSQPSSRPSTPGQFFPQSQSAPPSAYRQSWPRYAGDEEPEGSGSPTGLVRERRPSRLSLTLSMMEGSRESGETREIPASMSRRSTANSLGGGGGDGDVARSSSMSSEAHVPERSRSTLFVVNSEEPKRSDDLPPPG